MPPQCAESIAERRHGPRTVIRQDLELSERKCPRRSQARVVSGGHAPREVAEARFGADRGLRQAQLEQHVWCNVRRWWFGERAP